VVVLLVRVVLERGHVGVALGHQEGRGGGAQVGLVTHKADLEGHLGLSDVLSELGEVEVPRVHTLQRHDGVFHHDAVRSCLPDAPCGFHHVFSGHTMRGRIKGAGVKVHCIMSTLSVVHTIVIAL
jgi:hypothetical protein